jgi:hypothetical protein
LRLRQVGHLIDVPDAVTIQPAQDLPRPVGRPVQLADEPLHGSDIQCEKIDHKESGEK